MEQVPNGFGAGAGPEEHRHHVMAALRKAQALSQPVKPDTSKYDLAWPKSAPEGASRASNSVGLSLDLKLRLSPQARQFAYAQVAAFTATQKALPVARHLLKAMVSINTTYQQMLGQLKQFYDAVSGGRAAGPALTSLHKEVAQLHQSLARQVAALTAINGPINLLNQSYKPLEALLKKYPGQLSYSDLGLNHQDGAKQLALIRSLGGDSLAPYTRYFSQNLLPEITSWMNYATRFVANSSLIEGQAAQLLPSMPAQLAAALPQANGRILQKLNIALLKSYQVAARVVAPEALKTVPAINFLDGKSRIHSAQGLRRHTQPPDPSPPKNEDGSGRSCKVTDHYLRILPIKLGDELRNQVAAFMFGEATIGNKRNLGNSGPDITGEIEIRYVDAEGRVVTGDNEHASKVEISRSGSHSAGLVGAWDGFVTPPPGNPLIESIATVECRYPNGDILGDERKIAIPLNDIPIFDRLN